jgi:hypothetical protein
MSVTPLPVGSFLPFLLNFMGYPCGWRLSMGAVTITAAAINEQILF